MDDPKVMESVNRVAEVMATLENWKDVLDWISANPWDMWDLVKVYRRRQKNATQSTNG